MTAAECDAFIETQRARIAQWRAENRQRRLEQEAKAARDEFWARNAPRKPLARVMPFRAESRTK